MQGRQYKWGELLVTPYHDDRGRVVALHGATRDITDRRRTEEALRQSEEKYRLLSDNATDVLWTLDLATERFTYISPSIQVLRGYTPAEALALTLDRTLSPESYRRAKRLIKENLAEETLPGVAPDRLRLVQFEEYAKNGTVVQTEATVKFTRDEDGRPTGVIGISRDITARKRAEAEREQLISELHAALDQVKRLSGLLPICAACKKVRNDKGYWEQIEAFIRDRSEAEFSHSICPECERRLYPDLVTPA